LITLTADALNQENEPIVSNSHTNWDDFRCLVNERLPLNIPLKTEEDAEAAAKFFSDSILWAGWNATKQTKQTNSVALSPRTNYTDWATTTCRRNLVPTFPDRGVSRGQRGGSPTVVNLSFLDQSRYFSFK
jgi:hypothetical protein